MKQLHFRFSTALLRRLGEELNPSLERGLIELTKNAYDADATECVIHLMNTDGPGGTVRVSDNGSGMSADAIRDSWLVLGSSNKDRATRTPKFKRVPAGSKGLGRLAALRMGTIAVLTTRPEHNDREYQLTIDWKRFDKAKLVEDVDLTVQSHRRVEPQSHGTTIQLGELHHPVGRMEVKRIARELLLLADPFTDDPAAFRPVLVAPEFDDLARLVSTSYFNHADYRLVARINRKGKATAVVTDFRGETLFEANHGEIAAGRDGRTYEAPEAAFEFWTFILTKASFGARPVSLQEVREWLGQFGGVHIYDAGLRVHPYGNPGNDWLELNLRRVQSPEERPSTNNSIGRVVITDSKGQLIQKTDRSGFIESHAFNEVRAFCQDALDWMARRRMEQAENRRRREKEIAPKQISSSKRAVDKAINLLPEKKRPAIQRAIEQYAQSRDKEVAGLKQEVQLYRTLSTAGITAATFAHESAGSPIKVITTSIRTIEKRAKRELQQRYESTLREPVEGIAKATESLSVLGSATLRLVDHEKRRQTRVDLHNVIKGVFTTFAAFLAGRNIEALPTLSSRMPFLRGSEAAIESIVTNLLNNSIAAFEESNVSARKIWVETEVANDYFTMRISDNGPGIAAKRMSDIWLPGFSTRPNGTGLGLTIVRDSVIDLGGTVEATAKGSHGGAEFVVTLPILGS